MGKQISNDLKRIIKKYSVVKAEIITHLDTYKCNLTNIETIDTGPICLLYLEMIMSGLHNSSEFVSTVAAKSKFQVLAELNLLPYQRSKALIAAKNRFQKQCYSQVVVPIITDVLLGSQAARY
ncbi:unnamed protein product [Allacma fusca]|uniref:Uncharacterized protein n=1 Tax=Allacma fusca TaxID=39272 RepID=A0A8J2PB74_9HEXA|nr:unnamed protein product [Allacma fusca]